MAIRLETYYHIYEKEKRLSEIYQGYGERTAFIVPGGLDKDLIVRLACEGGSYFGAKVKAWTWSDLYKETCRGDAAAYRRIIDPPDHRLIISYVLDKFLSEADTRGEELPPGVRRRGFATVLGNNIRELLSEDLLPEQLRGIVNIEDDGAKAPEAILCRLYDDYLAYLASNRIADSEKFQL